MAWRARIGNVDDEGFDPALLQCLAHDRREFGIDEHGFGFAVIKNEGDCLSVEPDVDRIEHGARRGHPEQRFVKGGNIGGDDGHGIAQSKAAPLQRRT